MAESTDDDRSPPGRAGRSPRRWLLGVLAVVAVYAIGLVVVGIDEALGAFTRASVLPLAGALLLQVAVVLLWGKVYGASAVAVQGAVTSGGALRVSMPAFTLSHTLPGGGLTGNAVAVQRLTAQGMSGPGATAAVTLTATISLTTIAGLGSAGIVIAFLAGDLPTLALVVALPALVALLAVVASVVAVLRSPSTGDRAVDAVGRLHPRLPQHVDGWREALREVTEDPPTTGQLGRIAGWALGKWLADLASLSLVFVALDTTPRISALLVGIGVTQLATAIPLTPGGVGFAEGGMLGAFVALGYPAALATSVVLVYRVLETWLPTLAGIPVLLHPPPPRDADPDGRGTGLT